MNNEDGIYRLEDIFNSKEYQENWAAKSLLTEGLENADNYFQKLQAIRVYYEKVTPTMLETFRKSRCAWHSSYPFDWSRLFTPIEQEAWSAIRRKGRIVLYPQYPVLKYVIDFANPGLKIGLELDGVKFHNKERDVIRDAELKQCGWTIYRITGKEMMRSNYKEWYELEEIYENDYTDEDLIIGDIRHWILETGDGVIEAIREIHFSETTHRMCNETIAGFFRGYCQETLELHQY